MSATKRPRLKDARRQFFWGEHELIDYGIPAKIGTSAWAVYTALLRHLSDENGAFPSIQLLEAELGISNRVIANSLKTLAAVGLISIEREAHQWNVYYILDCLQAIKKNRWEKVKPKARDEKSPAEIVTAPTPEHVTKGHVARDERSPEHVTNRHTKKNQLKRIKEEGGALHVTGNPRAQEEPAAATVAVLEAPERTTSEQAAPPTASVAVIADGPLGAGAPNGATPEGLEVSDEDLKMLFERQDENAIDVEQVPGGAAVEEARPLDVDELSAVPEAVLLERPQVPTNDPAYKAIMALVGGSAKLEVYLAEETRSGGYGRERWLRLTLAEVELVKTTAQAQARRPGLDGKRVPFSTLSILGLDRLIGAPKLTGGAQKAAQPAGPYGNATKVTAPGQKLTAPPEEPSKFIPGSEWREKKSGVVLILRELVPTKNRNGGGMAYLMSDGKTATSLELMLKFEAV